MRHLSRGFVLKLVYLCYASTSFLLGYSLYLFFSRILEVGLFVGLIGLILAVYALILAFHLHLKSTLTYDELESIALITRDLFYREIILSLIDRGPLLHSDLVQRLRTRIPHSNTERFMHSVYIKLSELANLRYVKLKPTYNENERSWITQASFYDRDKEELFMKNRRLLLEGS